MRDEFDQYQGHGKVELSHDLGRLRQKTDPVGIFDTEPMTYV